MKKLFFLAALLCASLMGWAFDENVLFPADGTYANQFKWYSIDGVTAPMGVNSVEPKNTFDCIYVNVGQADFDAEIGIIGCELAGHEGAGVWIKISSLDKKENEIYFKNSNGTTLRGLIIYNELGKDVWEIYDTNFALASLGSTATASSGNAAMAIDGNTGTRWESATTKPNPDQEAEEKTIPMTDEEKNNQWWQVDMGQLRIYNTIQIVWEGAYGKTFGIEASKDGDNWKTVKQVVDQSLSGFPYEQILELAENDTARYIRFKGIARGTGYGYSFWEFRVLLPGVSVLTSIKLSTDKYICGVAGEGISLTTIPRDQNGAPMEAEINYEITPAAAGHMSGNTFIADAGGAASIVAYNGAVRSNSIDVYAYVGGDVALNKNAEASGYDEANNLYPSFAVDNNDGSLWSARTGETGDLRIYDAWIIVDLGAYYNINLIAIHWEGACSKHYHVDFSANKTDWRTAYNAGWNSTATHWEYLLGTETDATKVRYVRVWSTEAVSQYGIKIMSLKIFGTEWIDDSDTEKPVMTSAELIDKTEYQVIIEVHATDDGEIMSYHVVDNTNGIDANYAAVNDQITISDLTPKTTYNFTITAIDATGKESENSKLVQVTTDDITYCSFPTGHLNNPNFGDIYGRILLTIKKVNNSTIAVKVEPNNNGTKGIKYLDININGTHYTYGNNDGSEDDLTGFYEISGLADLNFTFALSFYCNTPNWYVGTLNVTEEELCEESPTSIENAGAEIKAVKMIENGQLVIIKNGVKYNVAGQQVK